MIEAPTRDAIRAEIESSNLSLSDVFARFSSLSQWDLRTLYADVKREQAYARIDDLSSSSPLAQVPKITKKGIEAMNAGWLRPMQVTFDTLPPSTSNLGHPGKITLVGSDIHAPDDDPHAMDLFYQIGRALNVDDVLIDGDWFDVGSMSKYVPSAERHLRWVDERRQNMHAYGGPVVMRQQFPHARIRFLPGNHDVRPLKWIDANAIPLTGLFSLEYLLGIDGPELNIETVHTGTIRLAEGNLIVKHGTVVSANPGASVLKEMIRAGSSVIMGHVHRRADIELTKATADWRGIELGCLCSLKPHYGNIEDVPNWQQGFAVVTEFDNGAFDVELVKIKDGTANFRGTRYVSRIPSEFSSAEVQ